MKSLILIALAVFSLNASAQSASSSDCQTFKTFASTMRLTLGDMDGANAATCQAHYQRFVQVRSQLSQIRIQSSPMVNDVVQLAKLLDSVLGVNVNVGILGRATAALNGVSYWGVVNSTLKVGDASANYAASKILKDHCGM